MDYNEIHGFRRFAAAHDGVARRHHLGTQEMGDLGDLDHRAEAVAQRVVRSQREGVRVPG